MERSSVLRFTLVSLLLKSEYSGRPRLQSPTLLFYFTIYIYIYIYIFIYIYIYIYMYIYIYIYIYYEYKKRVLYFFF